MFGVFIFRNDVLGHAGSSTVEALICGDLSRQGVISTPDNCNFEELGRYIQAHVYMYMYIQIHDIMIHVV